MWKKTGLIIIYLCAGNKTLLFEFEFGFYKMNLSNLSVEFHNCDVIFETQFDQKRLKFYAKVTPDILVWTERTTAKLNDNLIFHYGEINRLKLNRKYWFWNRIVRMFPTCQCLTSKLKETRKKNHWNIWSFFGVEASMCYKTTWWYSQPFQHDTKWSDRLDGKNNNCNINCLSNNEVV